MTQFLYGTLTGVAAGLVAIFAWRWLDGYLDRMAWNAYLDDWMDEEAE